MRTKLCTFLALFLLSLPAAAAEPRFFSGLSDIPLMPGLYEMADRAALFDQPEGRIAEAQASTEDIQASDIYRFYSETLPQLGWQPQGEGAFVRKGERLTLSVLEDNSARTLKILIEPR